MLRRLLSLLRLRQNARRCQAPAWQTAIDFRPRMEQLEQRSMLAVASIVATDNTAHELNESSGTFTTSTPLPARPGWK